MKNLIAFIIGVLILSVSTAQAFNPNEFCGQHDEMIAKVDGLPHNEKLIAVLDDRFYGGIFEVFANQSDDSRNSYTVFRTVNNGETCIITAGEVITVSNDSENEMMIALLDENDGYLYKIYRDAPTSTFIMIRVRYYDTKNPEIVAAGNVIKITANYKGIADSGK